MTVVILPVVFRHLPIQLTPMFLCSRHVLLLLPWVVTRHHSRLQEQLQLQTTAQAPLPSQRLHSALKPEQDVPGHALILILLQMTVVILLHACKPSRTLLTQAPRSSPRVPLALLWVATRLLSPQPAHRLFLITAPAVLLYLLL